MVSKYSLLFHLTLTGVVTEVLELKLKMTEIGKFTLMAMTNNTRIKHEVQLEQIPL